MSTNYAETADTPRTEIASVLDTLESEIGYTEKIAAELAERLYAAICPRGNDNEKTPTPPEPVRSPLGSAIHDQKVRLERINESLRRLMAALELPLNRELARPTETYAAKQYSHDSY